MIEDKETKQVSSGGDKKLIKPIEKGNKAKT